MIDNVIQGAQNDVQRVYVPQPNLQLKHIPQTVTPQPQIYQPQVYQPQSIPNSDLSAQVMKPQMQDNNGIL